jgi:hypothetical protein
MAIKEVSAINRYIGTAAERAAQTTTGILSGSTYFETDTGLFYIFDGTNWQTKKEGIQLAGSTTGVAVSAAQTRPANTTPYTALDVVGQDPAANMSFLAVGAAGSAFVILGARLRIDVAAIPAGMTSFRLHLYNAAPTAITDNLAYNLIAADRGKYLGFITIASAVDLGDTVNLQADELNFTGKLAAASTTLYGVLQTVGAYTPTSAAVKTITLNIAAL